MPTTTATAHDLIKRALRFIGQLAGGEDPAAEDEQDVLDVMNGMLDAWSMERLFVYNMTFATYALVAGTASYTIGQSGGPSFNAVRPNQIENANIVITSQSPNVRRPLSLLDDDDWAGISIRPLSGNSIPTALYYSLDYPNGTLNFWPTPQGGLSVELESWQQLAQFADPTALFVFPPGFYEAIYQNVALRLCTPEWGMNEPPASIVSLAEQSKARIQSLNMARAQQALSDVGMQGTRQQGNSSQLFNARNPSPQWYR